MRIGVVTFYALRENIGGGFTPAIAFKDWCDQYFCDYDCEVIGVAPTYHQMLNEGIDVVLHKGEEDILNDYDALFFITPPIFTEFNIDLINTPFMYMVHGEGDPVLYGEQIQKLAANENCIGKVDIVDTPGALTWYPCCRPEYLSNSIVSFNINNGFLYAARVCRWLNFELFMSLMNNDKYYSKLMGPVSNPETINKIEVNGHTIISLGVFNKDDIDYHDYRYFWDVAGNERKPFYKKRMSLSAHEALSRGLIPIVAEDQVPSMYKGVVLEIPRDCTPERFSTLVNNDIRTHGEVNTFSMVSAQINKILEKFNDNQQ